METDAAFSPDLVEEMESTFNAFLPNDLRRLASVHFTPSDKIILAAKWFEAAGVERVLDLGAGVGKFCVLAALNSPGVHYTGVEQRPSLWRLSETFSQTYKVANAQFILGNILDTDFKPFNGFYLFNPFYEQIAEEEGLTDEVAFDAQQHELYQAYTLQQFKQMPVGTVVIAYHGEQHEIPYTYELLKQSPDGLLKMWVKKWIV